MWLPFAASVQRIVRVRLGSQHQDGGDPAQRSRLLGAGGPDAKGWASRFGELHGIAGVQPRMRLEALPYVASSSR